jgi:hypothetical protein
VTSESVIWLRNQVFGSSPRVEYICAKILCSLTAVSGFGIMASVLSRTYAATTLSASEGSFSTPTVIVIGGRYRGGEKS